MHFAGPSKGEFGECEKVRLSEVCTGELLTEERQRNFSGCFHEKIPGLSGRQQLQSGSFVGPATKKLQSAAFVAESSAEEGMSATSANSLTG